MAKRKYYEEEDDLNFDPSGHLSGQSRLFDKHAEEDFDEEEEDNIGLDEEDFQKTKSEAYNDEFDVDKAKEQKKKKRIATVKPKLIGKHSLSYDTIFKGKKTNNDTDSDPEHIIPGIGGGFELNEDSIEFNESRNSIDVQTSLKIQQEVYKILLANSDINMKGSRRKPSAADLNSYYKVLTNQLAGYGFGKCEIFIELSSYFSDNTFSIFLLLKSEYKNMIIAELKDKYGLSDMDKIDFHY